MKAKLFLAAALSLTAAACSTGPAPDTTPSGGAQASSAAINPVGRYEFATTVQGQMVTGNIDIAGTAGSYTGQITTSITPPLPISGATVDGQTVIVTGNTPDGVITIRMNFSDGTNFSGGWELGGDSGNMTGRRVS